ncbi:MAG: DUF2306 domain-containing protein [Bryobacteraceae bacterium]
MKPNVVRALWTATVVLSLIGVAIVIRRMEVLSVAPVGSPRFPERTAMDPGFARHAVLTRLHILPGLVFIVLGPFQFMRSLRRRRPRLHRLAGRVFVLAGLVVGATALVMGPQMAIGGANETAATMLFAVIFLFALLKAFYYIRRGKVALHREWMIRAYAVGLAVTTIRPIVGVFFATSRLTHLTPHEFFGMAFWLGFTMHLIVAEAWINYTRLAIAGVG